MKRSQTEAYLSFPGRTSCFTHAVSQAWKYLSFTPNCPSFEDQLRQHVLQETLCTDCVSALLSCCELLSGHGLVNSSLYPHWTQKWHPRVVWRRTEQERSEGRKGERRPYFCRWKGLRRAKAVVRWQVSLEVVSSLSGAVCEQRQ